MSLFQEVLEKIPFQSSRTKAIEERGFLKTLGLIHFEHMEKSFFQRSFKKRCFKKRGIFNQKAFRNL